MINKPAADMIKAIRQEISQMLFRHVQGCLYPSPLAAFDTAIENLGYEYNEYARFQGETAEQHSARISQLVFDSSYDKR